MLHHLIIWWCFSHECLSDQLHSLKIWIKIKRNGNEKNVWVFNWVVLTSLYYRLEVSIFFHTTTFAIYFLNNMILNIFWLTLFTSFLKPTKNVNTSKMGHVLYKFKSFWMYKKKLVRRIMNSIRMSNNFPTQNKFPLYTP